MGSASVLPDHMEICVGEDVREIVDQRRGHTGAAGEDVSKGRQGRARLQHVIGKLPKEGWGTGDGAHPMSLELGKDGAGSDSTDLGKVCIGDDTRGAAGEGMEEEHGERRHVDIAGLKAHVLRQDVMLIEQEPVASRDGLGSAVVPLVKVRARVSGPTELQCSK